MSPDRRDFLWTLGAAAGALALLPSEEIFWTRQIDTDPGWTPGIEELLASACLLCPARCGIRGRVVDGRLVRILGNPFHPVSRGGVCARGVAGLQMLYHPDRITSPLVRTGDRGAGGWRPVSRDEAIAHIADRLRAAREAGRPDAVAALTGYSAGTMHEVWRQFLESFGSPNHVVDGFGDGTDAVMEAMHGIRRRPGYDLANADTVLSFGAPLFESWWSPLQAFVAFGASREGRTGRRRFIQVDHRFSRTAAYSDEWVGVRPGTHSMLALGMAYVILRDGLFDEGFLRAHVTGFEDFTDSDGLRREGFHSLVLRRYRSEEVSAATGVSVERITELARSFAGSRRPVAVCGPDVTLAPDGLLAGMAVHSLNVLVGSVNRPGGVLFGEDPPLAPLVQVVRDEASRAGLARDPVAGPQPAFGGGDPATRFARAVAADSSSPVDVLLVYGSDPLASSSHPDTWARAIANIPFVVSFSPFMDEVTRHADVVLPDLLPYERWQDAPAPDSYPYRSWGVGRPLVEPPAEGTHAGEAILALARALGGPIADSLPYESFESLLRARAHGLFEARRGRTFAGAFELENHRQREERGWWLPTQEGFDALWTELVERGGWVDLLYDHADPGRLARTGSGRIELMPPVLLQELEVQGVGGLPYVVAPGPDEAGDDLFPLRLLPYRVSTMSSDALDLQSWMAEQPTPLPDVQWTPWVSVAPVTAETLALEEDELVWVISRKGRYRALLRVARGTAPGTVCAPAGLRHPDGEPANPLRLLDDVVDPLTGNPSWHTTFVRLEPATGART